MLREREEEKKAVKHACAESNEGRVQIKEIS